MSQPRPWTPGTSAPEPPGLADSSTGSSSDRRLPQSPTTGTTGTLELRSKKPSSLMSPRVTWSLRLPLGTLHLLQVLSIQYQNSSFTVQDVVVFTPNGQQADSSSVTTSHNRFAQHD